MEKRVFRFGKITPRLAYVLGVYLGDGWASKRGGFGLFSIDKELTDCIKCYCESFVGPTPEVKPRQYNKGFNGKGANGWVYEFHCPEFCSWLKDITKNKAIVPDVIPVTNSEITKNLCEGFIDAEGWVKKSTKKTCAYGHTYGMGVCNTNLDLLNGVVSRLEQVGVRHGKLHTIVRADRVKPEYFYNLVLQDAVKSRLNLRTRRKAERLKEYASLNFKKPWNKGMTKEEIVAKIGHDYMKRNDLISTTTERQAP